MDILPVPRTEVPDCIGFGLRPTKATISFVDLKSATVRKASITAIVFSLIPGIESRSLLLSFKSLWFLYDY